MITIALLNFIRTQRSTGTTDDEIRQQLVLSGWRTEDIEAAFHSIDHPPVFVRGVQPSDGSQAQ